MVPLTLLASEAAEGQPNWLLTVIIALLGGGTVAAVISLVVNRKVRGAEIYLKTQQGNATEMDAIRQLLKDANAEIRTLKDERATLEVRVDALETQIDDLTRAPLAPTHDERIKYKAKIDVLQDANDKLLNRLRGQI